MSISKDQHHGLRVCPHDDVSSSDDDVKDPVPESYLNLSDEECDQFQNSSFLYGNLKQTKDAARSRARRVYTEAETNPAKPKIINSSNRYGDGTKRKPLSHSHKLSNYARRSPVLSKSELPQAPVIKLPYVSRGGDGYRTRRPLSGEIMIKENVPLENAELQTDFSLKSCGKRCDRTPSSKSDSLSNRLVLSSSGYSSSASGNGSFSSSTSSASITASSPLVTSSDSNRIDNVDTVSAVMEETDKNVSKARKVVLRSDNSVEEDNDDPEDVFPLTTWLESSEFSDIMKKHDSGTALNTVQEQPREKATLPDRISESDSVFRVKKNHSEPQLTNTTSRHTHSRLEIGQNSISMVEKPPTDKGRQGNVAVGGGVKLRMSSGRSSKKNDAVRSSLLFAYQTRGAADTLANVKENSESGDGIANRNTDNSFILPTPMNKLPDHYDTKTFSASRSFMRSSTDKSTSEKAPSRRMSERSVTSKFDSESISTQSSTTESSSPSKTAASTLSLSAPAHPLRSKRPERKLSLRNRLRGAFSFQNLRKAISSEKIDEEDRKSISHSYLNEQGEDIAQNPTRGTRGRPQSISGASGMRSGTLYKPPSISSVFGSVRMRSKRYRERRSTIDRNSIACDPKPIPEYDYSNITRKPSQSKDDNVGGPAHFRPIGRVLQMNVREGTMLIEMNKPSSGPFAFYVARRPDDGIVHISSLSDSYPDKMFAGLMKTGDEILEINEVKVKCLSLDQIYDMILENERLIIKTKPATAAT